MPLGGRFVIGKVITTLFPYFARSESISTAHGFVWLFFVLPNCENSQIGHEILFILKTAGDKFCSISSYECWALIYRVSQEKYGVANYHCFQDCYTQQYSDIINTTFI